jgi:hypothetical protein
LGAATQIFECRGEFPFNNLHASRIIANQELFLWFYGPVTYDDRFGTTQIHRFLLEYDTRGRRFTYTQHEGYSEDT